MKKILCLLIPILAAFGGYFLAIPLYSLLFLKEKGVTIADVPEGFKFGVSLLLLALTTAIVFFKTRNTNPIMKIRVLSQMQNQKEKNGD